MSGIPLDQAPESMSGYSCPFCPIVISEVTPAVSPALVAFERHLDYHTARGDRLIVERAVERRHVAHLAHRSPTAA